MLCTILITILTMLHKKTTEFRNFSQRQKSMLKVFWKAIRDKWVGTKLILIVGSFYPEYETIQISSGTSATTIDAQQAAISDFTGTS